MMRGSCTCTRRSFSCFALVHTAGCSKQERRRAGQIELAACCMQQGKQLRVQYETCCRSAMQHAACKTEKRLVTG